MVRGFGDDRPEMVGSIEARTVRQVLKSGVEHTEAKKRPAVQRNKGVSIQLDAPGQNLPRFHGAAAWRREIDLPFISTLQSSPSDARSADRLTGRRRP